MVSAFGSIKLEFHKQVIRQTSTMTLKSITWDGMVSDRQIINVKRALIRH